MQITELDHPLAATLLTKLRDSTTDRAGFRACSTELTRLLIAAATQNLATKTIQVDSPLGPAPGVVLESSPLLVPVLRAGLGMLDAALALLPESEVALVGVKRLEIEATITYEHYLKRLPADLSGQQVLVLDPMLATGGTLAYACEMVAAANAASVTAVCLLAAPEGVSALTASGAAQHLVTASVDSHLNAASFIVPGLGDAGDRLYGNT